MIQLMTDNPIHQLTIGQRHTLSVLRDQRWNYAAAARVLKVAETTVRTMIHRATRRAGVDTLEDLAYWLGREDQATG